MGEEQKKKKNLHIILDLEDTSVGWVPNYGPEPTQFSACFHAKNWLVISQGDTRDNIQISRYVTWNTLFTKNRVLFF